MKSAPKILFEVMLKVVRFLRVQDWFYLVGIAVLVLVRNRESVDLGIAFQVVSFSSCYLCWGYVFNNCFDQHEDSLEKNVFKTKSRATVVAVTLLLTGALVALAGVWEVLGPTVGVIVLNVAYSAPPIRLKRILPLSLLSNAVFFGFIAFSASQLIFGYVSEGEWAFAGFVAVLFIPLQYVHFLEHEEEAGRALTPGQRTLGIFFFATVVAYVLATDLFASIFFVAAIVGYCGLSSTMILRMKSASRARRELRYLSLGFGLVLFANAARFL